MRDHRLLQRHRSEGRRRRPGFFRVERPDHRQGLVPRALAQARSSLATEAIPRSVRLPTGPLVVSLRSLQRQGLLRAVRGRPGRPAGWTLMPYAAAILGATHPPAQ